MCIGHGQTTQLGNCLGHYPITCTKTLLEQLEIWC